MADQDTFEADFYSATTGVFVEIDPMEGMTRTEFGQECDINVLLAKYEKTGVLTHLANGQPEYFDCPDAPDLREHLALFDEAQAAFMRLNPRLRRDAFNDDPLNFVSFASDPANLDKMIEYGLAPPRKVADAVSAPSPAPAAATVPNAPVSP